MMFKVLTLVLLVACTQAIHYDGHDATSSVVFNDNHNSVHHIQSAYAAPSHGYSSPVASYSSHAAPVSNYAAPAIKVAAPVLLKSAGPSHGASSYSSLSFGGGGHYAAPAPQYAAPVAHYAAPVAHYAAPVAKVAAPLLLRAAPSHHASSYSSFGGPSAHIGSVAKVAVAPVAFAHAAPAYNQGGYGGYHQQEEYAHPKYEFAYGVEDHHTGDIHSHKETRDGDVTHGEYSLHEADGTVRTVKYSVDKHSGFNAVVERSGHATHAQPSKALVAAPIIKAVAPAPYYHH